MMPKDPVILLSYVNTQLRDKGENLEEFCKRMLISSKELKIKLAGIDYHYDSGQNQFI